MARGSGIVFQQARVFGRSTWAEKIPVNFLLFTESTIFTQSLIVKRSDSREAAKTRGRRHGTGESQGCGSTNRTIQQMLNERASRVEAYSDHITNGAFVIGQARKDWRDLDFAVMRMRMSADDKTIVETEGGHAFVDPFPGVVVLANELRRGPGLQAG